MRPLKIAKIFSGIVTSTFKAGTGGCDDWFTSPRFLVCGSLSGISPIFFVLYSRYSLSKVLSLTSTSSISSL